MTTRESQLRFASFLLCEGFAYDSRGVPTLVGVNVNVIAANELPHVHRGAVFLSVIDPGDELAPGTTATLRLKVVGPDGRETSLVRGDIEIAGKPYEGLPGSIQLALPVQFEVEVYGRHEIVASLAVKGGVTASGSTEMWAVTKEMSTSAALNG